MILSVYSILTLNDSEISPLYSDSIKILVDVIFRA